jgi:hypothetical protein
MVVIVGLLLSVSSGSSILGEATKLTRKALDGRFREDLGKEGCEVGKIW